MYQKKENGNIQQLPYDKFIKNGPQSLSDEELLAIILRTGTKGEDAVTLACRVLELCGEQRGIEGLHHVTLDRLMQINGIGEVKAVKLKAIAELSTRIANAKVKKDIETNALIEGAFYKINDYTTVINSSNYDDIEVTSNSNPFDIIVLATANNRLSETAWAMQNDNSGDRGLGNDIDVDGNTVTSFINIYEDRTFIPKYYYRNSLGFITYYTPTNSKILSFKNNFKTYNSFKP